VRRLLGGMVQIPEPKITDTDVRSNYQTSLYHGFGGTDGTSVPIRSSFPPTQPRLARLKWTPQNAIHNSAECGTQLRRMRYTTPQNAVSNSPPNDLPNTRPPSELLHGSSETPILSISQYQPTRLHGGRFFRAIADAHSCDLVPRKYRRWRGHHHDGSEMAILALGFVLCQLELQFQSKAEQSFLLRWIH
jgi:hypothetical protein